MADSSIRATNQKPANNNEEIGSASSDSPSIVICRGASAGGLEALEAFFTEMPRMDGTAVLSKLRSNERTRAIPICMLSTSNQVKQVES